MATNVGPAVAAAVGDGQAGAAKSSRTPDPAAARSAIRKLSQTSLSTGVAIGLAADAGVGKTTLVGTLPADKTLYIDVEGGADVLAGWDGATMVLSEDLVTTDLERLVAGRPAPVVSLRDCMAYLAVVTPDEYRFVVIDSGTNLEKRMLDSMKTIRQKEFSELREKGDLGEKMQEYCRKLTDLRWRGINVVIIVHQTKSMRGEEGVAYPLLQDKTARTLLGLVSAMGFMAAQPDGTRTIQWHPTAAVRAKSRYDCLGAIEQVKKDDRTYLVEVFRRIHLDRMQKFERGVNPDEGAKPEAAPTSGGAVAPAPTTATPTQPSIENEAKAAEASKAKKGKA